MTDTAAPVIPTTPVTPAEPAKKEWGSSFKQDPATNQVPTGTSVAPDAGTKPVEIKPDAATGERKFKVKVDGQELEVTEQELISGFALNKTATQKMQEAASVRKQAENFIELLRKDPMKVLNNPSLGVDVKKFAEEYLIQMYQDEMDPVTAENRKLKAQLEEIEANKKQKELEEQELRNAEETQHWMNHYVQDIDGAIASSPTLPRNNKAVYERVLHYMILGHQDSYIQRNGRAASAADVLPLVEKEFREMTTSLYKDATPEQLMNILGEDIAKKIRKHDISRLTNNIPEPKSKPKFTSPSKPEKPKGLQDFREALKEKDKNRTR
jgi:hypothetical protein